MGRYNIHPAQKSGHYHNEKHYKDRRPTLEQQEEQLHRGSRTILRFPEM